MKKKSIINYIGISLAICLIVSLFPANVFAATPNPQATSYFSENTVLAYGQSFINTMVSAGKTTKWTKDTKDSEIIKTYDADGNVNAYIINLETNSQPSGYMLIEAYTSGEPNIMQYGYSGVYYLTDDKLFGDLKTKHIIYAGNSNFFTESGGLYYDAESGAQTDLSKDKIKDGYTHNVQVENTYLSTNKPSRKSLQTNSLSITPQAALATGSVANLSGFSPYTMDYFVQNESYYLTNHCTPTCGMNMLKYWRDRRGIGNLFLDSSGITTFTVLRTMMQCNNSGTPVDSGYAGVSSYISYYGLTYQKGSDYKTQSGFSWSWIKTQVTNGNPFCMNADVHYYDSKYTGLHSFFGVGYQETSSADYVQVVDEWHTNLDNYYEYLWSNVDDIWYYRWA